MGLNNITIRNNSFYNNTEGISFYTDAMDNIKIINNSWFNFGASRGIYLSCNLTNTIILNNAIDGNGGSSTTGVYVTGNYNSGTLDYNNLFDIDTDYNIGGGAVFPGGNNIDENPHFYLDGIYLKIKGKSGNIDKGAGNGTYSDVPTDDINGVSRPVDIPEMNDADDGTDIGAEEFDPPVYYMDGAQTGSGHAGTQGDPWSKADFDTWHSAGSGRTPTGEIIKAKGEFVFTAMTSTAAHYFIDKWAPEDDPWIFRFTGTIGMFSGSFPRNGIISVDTPTFSFAFLDPPSAVDIEEVLNCIFLVNANTIFDTLYVNFKGCTIVSNVNFSQAPSGTFTDCIFDVPSMDDAVSTFNNCAFNLASLGGSVVTNDCQLNWTPPTWPAYDGTKSEWNSDTLASNLSAPAQPGNPPYTNYATGLWGESRYGIGGFSFLLNNVYFVNANGSGIFPFSTEAKGATNFKDLLDNITQQDNDIIEVSDDGLIDDSGDVLSDITKQITVRSYSGNTSKPIIKAHRTSDFIRIKANSISGLKIQNLRMYKEGLDVDGTFIDLTWISPVDSIYTDLEISGNEFWTQNTTGSNNTIAICSDHCLINGNSVIENNTCYNLSTNMYLGPDIDGLTIQSNEVYDGGAAIVIQNDSIENLEILKNNFHDCTTLGIYVINGTVDGLGIKNNIMYNIGSLGGIRATGCTLFDDCSIVNNSFRNCDTVGIHIDTGNPVINTKIINNIIDGVSSITTIGMYIRDYNSGTLDYNDVYDCGTAYDLTGSVSVGPNSISVDPEFVSTTDLQIKLFSPCVDKGVGNGIHSEVPTEDFLGRTRPLDIEGISNVDDGVDIGAYEIYPVSNLDTGVVVDISSGAVDVVSTIFDNILELMPSVVANPNFDNANKWNTVVVLYEHTNGQNKKMVHKSRSAGWTARENFSEFANAGTWGKNKVILLDNENDVLVIDRNELGSGEDITVTT